MLAYFALPRLLLLQHNHSFWNFDLLKNRFDWGLRPSTNKFYYRKRHSRKELEIKKIRRIRNPSISCCSDECLLLSLSLSPSSPYLTCPRSRSPLRWIWWKPLSSSRRRLPRLQTTPSRWRLSSGRCLWVTWHSPPSWWCCEIASHRQMISWDLAVSSYSPRWWRRHTHTHTHHSSLCVLTLSLRSFSLSRRSLCLLKPWSIFWHFIWREWKIFPVLRR